MPETSGPALGILIMTPRDPTALLEVCAERSVSRDSKHTASSESIRLGSLRSASKAFPEAQGQIVVFFQWLAGHRISLACLKTYQRLVIDGGRAGFELLCPHKLCNLL